MKTNRLLRYLMLVPVVLGASVSLSSCPLEENNPGGFTKENLATSRDGYRAIVNNCYFGMERRFYATGDFGYISNAPSDLWTSRDNLTTRNAQYFWFYGGASPDVTSSVISNFWNGAYDGVGSCNDAIRLAELCPMDQAEKNEWLGEAHFMRAIYYYHLVEQFNGCTIVPDTPESPNYSPEKSDPLTVYKEVIIPDLLFALENLRVGTDAESTYPHKKTALGFLAKAYLSMMRHDNNNTSYASEALKYAQLLINDAESGGGQYNAHLYADYADVFKDENNYTNKEALWKHRWYSGSDGYGSSMGAQNLNMKHTYFYCQYTNFGAMSNDLQWYRLTWGGNQTGNYMPTQHLLSLFDNEDGTLDPRFDMNFQREWNANQSYTWSAGDAEKYEKNSSVVGKTLEVGDLAIKIIMPQDPDYATELANRATSTYVVVDYKDVYDDATKKVLMEHINAITGNKDTENFYRYFYPSLTKFNTTNYYVVNASNRRNANLNNVFMMRMAEVYLLAAEADFYVNGGSNALGYLNKLRARAGAAPLSGTVTMRTIMDESGRELCGEDTRFYDLKRWGVLNNSTYLTSVHPELVPFYKTGYEDRPIPSSYVGGIENGKEYQNPAYQ